MRGQSERFLVFPCSTEKSCTNLKCWNGLYASTNPITIGNSSGELSACSDYIKSDDTIKVISVMRNNPVVEMNEPELDANNRFIEFDCNLCGASNGLAYRQFHRELQTCTKCGSNVRFRSMIYIMAQQLFGLSFMLHEFPMRRDIRGIGMSDALQYADFLEQKFDYANTYYHQQPMLDIMNPDFTAFSDLDFIISSDVFEHVLPPVSTAFENSYKLLNDKGFLLLTVPYDIKLSQTIERYPDINDFEVLKDSEGEYFLRNTTQSGEQQLYDNLIFHGGPGSTLEMRRFCETHVLELLEQAGFSEIAIFDSNIEHFGIIWKDRNSLPIIARK